MGPPFLIDLCTLLLRFRSHKFALVTDIEKAFLHVQLAEGDRNYTHFLWLSKPDNPKSKFAIYRFRVPNNRNIWRNKILANRLNSPFGENLNWRQGFVRSRDLYNMDTHKADSCVRGFQAYSDIWTPFCGGITDVQTGKWKSISSGK